MQTQESLVIEGSETGMIFNNELNQKLKEGYTVHSITPQMVANTCCGELHHVYNVYGGYLIILNCPKTI